MSDTETNNNTGDGEGENRIKVRTATNTDRPIHIQPINGYERYGSSDNIGYSNATRSQTAEGAEASGPIRNPDRNSRRQYWNGGESY